MSTATSPRVYGRTVRRLANRDRILDAALDLVAEGAELDAEAIAARADVSVRSIYNHFPTARALVAGLYARSAEKVRPMFDDLPDPSVPFDRRVREWARVWGHVQEAIAPIRWRALVAEDQHPDLQPELAQLRRLHRAEIRHRFPEIAGRRKLEAIALAMSDSLTWRALRRHQKLSVDAACEVIEESLRRLVR